MLTIAQARKILGKTSNNTPDNQLLQEIQAANLFKDLFFKIYHKGKQSKRAVLNSVINVK